MRSLKEFLAEGEGTTKIHWKVSPAATGPYRSFQHRGWPMAHHAGPQEHPAALITSTDDYHPARAKTGDHAELRVHIAQYHHDDESRKKHGAFSWRRLKTPAKTLDHAKKLAQSALDAHPHFHPKDR